MSIIKEIKTNTINENYIEEGAHIVNFIGYANNDPDNLQRSLYGLCRGLEQHVNEVANGDLCKLGSYSVYEGIICGKRVTICNVFCKYKQGFKNIFLKTQALTSGLVKLYREQDIRKVFVVYLGFRNLNHLVEKALPVKTTMISDNI